MTGMLLKVEFLRRNCCFLGNKEQNQTIFMSIQALDSLLQYPGNCRGEIFFPLLRRFNQVWLELEELEKIVFSFDFCNFSDIAENGGLFLRLLRLDWAE